MHLYCRFFIDRSPGDHFVVSEEDKVRISQRGQRFSQGVDGNRRFKPKLSLDDLIKSAVSSDVHTTTLVL